MIEAMPVKPIERRILDVYDKLSRNERRLADVLLESPRDLASYSATELSDRAGVSKSTSARLFKRLGYASFREARRQARQLVNKDTAIPFTDIPTQKGLGVDLSLHLTADLQNLIRTTEALRSDAITQAVDILADAQRVWVVGFGDNYPLAHFARAMLIRVKPMVRMLPMGGFSLPEELAGMRQETDALLAFGMRRRTPTLLRTLRASREFGIHSVMMTDGSSTRAADLSDVAIRCRTRGASIFDSFVAPVSVLTHLCAALAARLGEEAVTHLNHIDAMHERWGEPEPGEF